MSKYSFTLSPLLYLVTMLFFHSSLAYSNEEAWVVNDIRISGLQRVSAGSIFNVMPIAVGDTVDVYDLQTTAKTTPTSSTFDNQLCRATQKPKQSVRASPSAE